MIVVLYFGIYDFIHKMYDFIFSSRDDVKIRKSLDTMTSNTATHRFDSGIVLDTASHGKY